MEQKKRISIITILIISLVLILGGVWFGFSYINNPKVILSKIVEKTFNGFSEALINSNVISKESKTINGNMALKTNLDLTNLIGSKVEIDDLNLNWKSEIDSVKKAELLNTSLSYNKEDLFNFEIITKDDKGYVYVKDLLEDYYMFSISSQNDNLVVDKQLFKSLTKLMEVSLKDENFVTTKEDITLNSKTISTNKHVLTIDESNIARIAKSGAEYIKKDEYLINKLIANGEITKEDLIKSLDDFIKSDSTYAGTDAVQIYFNTNNFGKLYKFGINVNNQINIYSSENDNYSETCIDVSGVNMFKMDSTIDKTKYNVNFKLTYDGVELTGNISSENLKDGTIKIMCTQNTTEIAKIDGTYLYEINNGITKFNLDLKPFINKEEIGTINLVLNNEVKNSDSIDIKIPTNVVDTENMTAEQEEKFNTAISSITSMLGLEDYMSDLNIGSTTLNDIEKIENSTVDTSTSINLGEKVTVDGYDGKYDVWVEEAKYTTERNEFSTLKPKNVIILYFSYKNIDSKEDVYLSSSDFKLVDDNGNILKTYPVSDYDIYGESVAIGEKSRSSAGFALDENTKYITVKCLDKNNKDAGNFKIEIKR